MKKISIAIDGHSSCGKSTMAKQLAQKIGYVYVDTGAMYRAITLYALQNNIINTQTNTINEEKLSTEIIEIKVSFVLNKTTNLPETILNSKNVEQEIRTLEVSKYVSKIAEIPCVRTKLEQIQKDLGKQKSVVMDGRDIGTVIIPNAELKVFVTANPTIRAERRLKEMQAKGINTNINEVLDNLKERDYIDMNRKISPLKQAEDAIILDNSHISIEQQLDWLIEKYKEKAKK